MSDKFEVEVREATWDKEQFELRVTHNGYQWTVITLAKDEIPKVIEALQRKQK